MMSRQRTPTSLALVEDDRFLDAARRLLDTRVLPTYAEGNLLFGEAGFHTDCGTGIPGRDRRPQAGNLVQEPVGEA